MLTLSLALAVVLGVVASALLFRRAHSLPTTERAALACLPLAVVLVIALGLLTVLGVPLHDWNAGRLAPIAGMFRGYQLYYAPAETGPLANMYYGPVTALVFAPAALLGEPTHALLAAGFTSWILMVLPLAAALLVTSPRPGDRLARLRAAAAFVTALGLLYLQDGTEYMITSVHADAPALGFGLVACLFLMAERAPSLGRLAGSALFAALAIWAKHLDAPLLIGLALHLWLAHGARLALRFAVLATAALGGLAAVFIVGFGFEELLYNLVILPARNPWKDGALTPLAYTGYALVMAAPALALALPALRARWRALEDTLRGVRALLAREPWTLLYLVALALVPTSLLSALKYGGGFNSFHFLYYTTAALALAWSRYGLPSGRGAARVGHPGLVYLLSGVVLLAALGSRMPILATLSRHEPDNQQLAFEFARAHPGEAYFPWQNLASLLAEGKLYHFDRYVREHELLGMPPSRAHMQRFSPERLRFLAYPPNAEIRVAGSYFPELEVRVELDALPGWEVWVRRDDPVLDHPR